MDNNPSISLSAASAVDPQPPKVPVPSSVVGGGVESAPTSLYDSNYKPYDESVGPKSTSTVQSTTSPLAKIDVAQALGARRSSGHTPRFTDFDDEDLAMNATRGRENSLGQFSVSALLGFGKKDNDRANGPKTDELTQVELQNLRRIFAIYDTDHSGSIDVVELKQMMQGLGIPITSSECERLMASMDSDGNSTLEIDEFVQMMLQNPELIAMIRRQLASTEDIMVREALRSKRFMPDAQWRWAWDSIQMMVILYWCITTPMWIVGAIRPEVYWGVDHNTFLALEIVFSFLLFMDMCIRMNTAFVQEGRLVTEFRLICWAYVRRWLIVDIICVLPIDLILRACGYDPTGPWHAVASSLRLLSISKIYRLFRPSEVDYYVTAMYINFHYQIVPTLILLFWSILVFHWCAVIAMALGIGLTDPRPSVYMTCLYWIGFTLSTCGYGDVAVLTVSQQIFACILFFISIVINGLVVAKLADVVQNKSLKETAQQKMRQTLTLLNHFRIPKGLTNSILSFQHHLLRHKLSESHAEVVANLPGVMQDQLALHMRISFISNVALFQQASLECRIALAQELRSFVVCPGEFLVVAGELGTEMMLLSHGFAEVLSADGEHIATLKPGNFFGVAALLNDQVRRTTSVRALTFCDLLSLGKAEFADILGRFPGFAHLVQGLARRQIERRKSFVGVPPNLAAASSSRDKMESLIPGCETTTSSTGLNEDDGARERADGPVPNASPDKPYAWSAWPNLPPGSPCSDNKNTNEASDGGSEPPEPPTSHHDKVTDPNVLDADRSSLPKFPTAMASHAQELSALRAEMGQMRSEMKVANEALARIQGLLERAGLKSDCPPIVVGSPVQQSMTSDSEDITPTIQIEPEPQETSPCAPIIPSLATGPPQVGFTSPDSLRPKTPLTTPRYYGEGYEMPARAAENRTQGARSGTPLSQGGAATLSESILKGMAEMLRPLNKGIATQADALAKLRSQVEALEAAAKTTQPLPQGNPTVPAQRLGVGGGGDPRTLMHPNKESHPPPPSHSHLGACNRSSVGDHFLPVMLRSPHLCSKLSPIDFPPALDAIPKSPR